jgi:hypothetical protein
MVLFAHLISVAIQVGHARSVLWDIISQEALANLAPSARIA